MDKLMNPTIEQAVNKAMNVVSMEHLQKYHGMKHTKCGKRNTRSVGDGEYYCNPCSEKFTFNDWYLKVCCNGPKAIA